MRRKKKIAAAVVPCVCALSVGVAAQGGDIMQDNFVKISSAQTFSQGQLSGLAISEQYGDGALVLDGTALEGIYISPELSVPAFEYLVASWFADTPRGTTVEISMRAYVDMHSEWTSWLSWGQWSPYIERSSTDQSDDLAKISTDLFTILGSDGQSASKIQFKVILRSDSADKTAVLRAVSATFKNTLPGQQISVWQPLNAQLPEKVILDTPAYSQMNRDPQVASLICSPTVISMLIGAQGTVVFPEEQALQTYDFKYEGFGNWSYSVAAAGMYGYDSFVHYADFDFIKQQLAAGYPVGLSVRYSASPDGPNPYLENGAAGNTPGHLICIVGYETIDGTLYFYSNDSGAKQDSSAALVRYRADQLDVAWSNRIVYVVGPKEQGAGFAAPERTSAQLTQTDEPGIYSLSADGQTIELPMAFLSQKTSVLGGGIMFLVPDDAKLPEMPQGISLRQPNTEVIYSGISVTQSGQIRLSDDKIMPDAQQGTQRSFTLWVMQNDGASYHAPITLTASGTAEEQEIDTAAQVDLSEQEGQSEEQPQKGGVRIALAVGIGTLGIAAAAGAVFTILKKRKK